jgi:predicted dehydrogenase
MRPTTTRRELLTLAAGAGAGALAACSNVHAAGGDLLRIGLVGCGGRGTGAASQALAADPNVKLVAMADAFEDRLQESLSTLQGQQESAGKIDVPPERRFVGFDAYKKLIDCVDVVLLCTPPHFRPIHLEAAVEAGKHVFAEKPVAVDAPGVRSVLKTCAQARDKGLSLVSGLCLRYDAGFCETVRRIFEDSAIGGAAALLANDYRSGRWTKPRQPGWSEMTYQMRNWYNFTWLSGDFNVEQHVHYLDVCAWVRGNHYPSRAIGMGGRQVFTGEEYGNIYDHFSVVYAYDDDTRIVSNCRQQPGCKNDMSAQVLGTRGVAFFAERRGGLRIVRDGQVWTFTGQPNAMYQVEHNELFASIRNGIPINNGEYMAKSTLLAIMGRMAAYTGQEITWEMALNSKEDLSPSAYMWDGTPPPATIAVPGQTRFI